MLTSKLKVLKRLLLPAPVFLIFLFVLFQQSCKKTDIIKQEEIEIDAAIKFFELPVGTNPTVIRIADKIKQQNDQRHFLNKFVKKQGYAVWDKVLVVKSSQSASTSAANQSSFGNNTNPSLANDNTDQVVFIPLVLKDSIKVHGALSCKISGDSISIALIDGSQYNRYTAHPEIIGVNGEQATLLLMKLDKLVFNHSLFKVTDSAAFGININPKTKWIKIIDTTVTTNRVGDTGSSVASATSSVGGHWEYYNITIDYITYEVKGPVWGDPLAPEQPGTLIEVHHYETISGWRWVEDPWMDEGDEEHGPNGGGGGGNNNGGNGNNGSGSSGGNDLPVEPDYGEDPSIPPPPNCDQYVKNLESNVGFVTSFKYLNTSGPGYPIGASNEIGYEIRDIGQYNNTSYFPKSGTVDKPEIDWVFPGNTLQEGLLHSHYAGLNSIFSPQDVILMARMFLNNHAKDPSNLFFGVTSSYGDPMLMKVGDVAKFRAFCENIVGVNGNDDKKILKFTNDFYNKTNSDNPATNEREFLKMIKQYGGEDGLKLYSGNTDCSKWTQRRLVDNFGTVGNVECI